MQANDRDAVELIHRIDADAHSEQALTRAWVSVRLGETLGQRDRDSQQRVNRLGGRSRASAPSER